MCSSRVGAMGIHFLVIMNLSYWFHGQSRVPEDSDCLRTELYTYIYMRGHLRTWWEICIHEVYYRCICSLNWKREVMEECHWMLQNVLFVLQEESFILCMMFAVSLSSLNHYGVCTLNSVVYSWSSNGSLHRLITAHWRVRLCKPLNAIAYVWKWQRQGWKRSSSILGSLVINDGKDVLPTVNGDMDLRNMQSDLDTPCFYCPVPWTESSSTTKSYCLG